MSRQILAFPKPSFRIVYLLIMIFTLANIVYVYHQSERPSWATVLPGVVNSRALEIVYMFIGLSSVLFIFYMYVHMELFEDRFHRYNFIERPVSKKIAVLEFCLRSSIVFLLTIKIFKPATLQDIERLVIVISSLSIFWCFVIYRCSSTVVKNFLFCSLFILLSVLVSFLTPNVLDPLEGFSVILISMLISILALLTYMYRDSGLIAEGMREIWTQYVLRW